MLRTCFTDDGLQVTEPEVDVSDRAARPARRQPAAAAGQAGRAPRASARTACCRSTGRRCSPSRSRCCRDDLMRLHVGHDGLVMDGISMFMFFIDWHRAYAEGTPPAGDDVPFADYVAALEAMRGSGPAAAVPRRTGSTGSMTCRRTRACRCAANPASDHPAAIHPVRGQARTPGSWAKLKAAAAAAGLTPTVVLLAAYAETLARWGAGNRFTLTTTVANRPPIHPSIADAIGNFSETMLVEIGIDRRLTLHRAGAGAADQAAPRPGSPALLRHRGAARAASGAAAERPAHAFHLQLHDRLRAGRTSTARPSTCSALRSTPRARRRSCG